MTYKSGPAALIARAEQQFENGYHRFHIPVMGTGFTIDTPLRIGKYGVASVISLGDDVLIEQIRKRYCKNFNRTYEPIEVDEPNARSRRITAYLNLVNELLSEQIDSIRQLSFDQANDLTDYFELLPDGPLKEIYHNYKNSKDPKEKAEFEIVLRRLVKPGGIDVNIMSKLDTEYYRGTDQLPPEQGVAMSAMRGFANSTLSSSIVLSAGLNRRLYSYMKQFNDFLPDQNKKLKKKIVIKVSDYRSAIIQGKFLAKQGLWVSEFRVESGLNCGGHAFGGKGFLLGPILEEFVKNKTKLSCDLFELYQKGLGDYENLPANPYPIKITVQGGVGTHAEQEMLYNQYGVDSVGWGTPFLLVPEVTNVDTEHIKKLSAARESDISLSNGSPMGIPFWRLNNSSSEENRLNRIKRGNPGSPCPKGFLKLDNELSEQPICRASKKYQKEKIKQINKQFSDEENRQLRVDNVLQRACLCEDLAGGAMSRHNISGSAKSAVCCGPNIAFFDKVASFKEMVGHIYGRLSLINRNDRPNMFIKELELYVERFKKEIKDSALELIDQNQAYFNEYIKNIFDGIHYYKKLAQSFVGTEKNRFTEQLEAIYLELKEFIRSLAPGVKMPEAIAV